MMMTRIDRFFGVFIALLAAGGLLSDNAYSAETSGVLTDADGDTYEVMLAGPGGFTLSRVDAGGGNGPIDGIVIEETTPRSSLRIAVTQAGGGDGRVAMFSLSGATPLKSFTATAVDLTNSVIDLPQGIGAITVGDIGANVAVRSGGQNRQLKGLSLVAGTIGTGFVLEAPAQTLTFRSAAVAGGTISARNVGKFSVEGGGFAGLLRAERKIASVSIEGGNLAGTLTAPLLGPIRVLRGDGATGGNLVGAVIAALKIGPLKIDGDVIDSKILAGTQLGADGLLGGGGADSDIFNAGKLGSVKIGGSVSSSIIGAGYGPFDAVFADANDGIYGGKRSKLGPLTITGTIDDASRFGAGVFSRVKIDGAVVKPKLDLQHFVLRRLLKGAVPPNPASVAQTLSTTEATVLTNAVSFLYTGKNPIQTGVAPGTIKATRVAVLRGAVRARGGGGIDGVTVSVLDHPEFGETGTRLDGGYDLAVNGGGPLTLVFEKDGFLPLQRSLPTPMQDYVTLSDVSLVAVDSLITLVTFNGGDPVQVHHAGTQQDGDGPRRAALLFQEGTIAFLDLPDGTSQPASRLSIRATEYTVGPDGSKSMPGMLPPTSAYTYCVDFSADEATAIGAEVRFTKPAWLYLDNFLNFPVGEVIPNGSYDTTKAQWEASASGRVIKILGITDGRANLDTDGDGNAENPPALAALSITVGERAQLAQLYSEGKILWRAPIAHFSPWDCNWPYGPPPDAEPPGGGPPPPSDPPNDPDECDGCSIQPQDQVLGERLRISGIPFDLTYRSNRVPGYKAANRLSIPLSGSTIPASLKRIELEVQVAGRSFRQEFAPETNLITPFEWDGLDAYQRPVLGRQPAIVRVANIFDGSYQRASRFGYNGNGLAITGDAARREITISTQHTTRIGPFDIRPLSLGGWTFDVHHVYDPIGRLLYEGDGTTRSVGSVNALIATVAGTGELPPPLFDNQNKPATEAKFAVPFGVAVAPDGTVLMSDGQLHQIYRLGTDGKITVLAGTGEAGFSGDTGPATAAKLNAPFGLSLGPDGTLYFCDFNNARIRKIAPDGTIDTVAGTGAATHGGDNGPATEAQINRCTNVFAALDGTLYIADVNNHRVRRVGTDGIITTVAGTGDGGYNGDNIPATAAQLSFPQGVVQDAEGNLFIADNANRCIRKVGPDGMISTYAGVPQMTQTNPTDPAGDGGQATLAKFRAPVAVALDPDGALIICDAGSRRYRRVSRDGVIVTIAGTGVGSAQPTDANGDGGAALQAILGNQPTDAGPQTCAFATDGTMYIPDTANRRLRRITSPLPGFNGSEIALPSEDGRLIHRFDATGRHLSTRHSLTGATLYTFAYDAGGRLTSIADANANTTKIERTKTGAPKSVIGPFGHKSVLALDENGSLASVKDALSGVTLLTSTADGLLLTEINPAGDVETFTYNASGLLTKADEPGPRFQTLDRAGLPGGQRVTQTTALNVTTEFAIQKLPTGDELRTTTDAAGLVTSTLLSADGTQTITQPDGTEDQVVTGPDPRFALRAPVATQHRTTTPGGKQRVVETTRTTVLSNPQDPLSFTALNQITKVNDRVFHLDYDVATRTYTTNSPLNRSVTVKLDAQGRTEQVIAGDIAPRNLRYDTRGRLSKITTGTGVDERITSIAYTSNGLPARITNPVNQADLYYYDELDRLSYVAELGGKLTYFYYNDAGLIESIAPGGRPRHRFTYTPEGQIESYVAPDAGDGPAATTYAYNPAGQIETITHPGAQTVTFGYDDAGRMSTRTVAEGVTTVLYDPMTGNRASLTGPNGDALTFAFDGSAPTGETWTGTVAGSVARTINDDLLTETQSINGGNTVTYSYDDDGALDGVGALTLSRAPTTGIISGAEVGTVTDVRTPDDFGQIESVTASSTVTGALFSAVYTRDKAGRIEQVVETVANGAPETLKYTYDVSGQLKEFTKNGALVNDYRYDAHGNRTTDGNVTATYDAQDRIIQHGATAYTHTLKGDLLTRTTPAGMATFTHDALGNLLSVALPGNQTVSYVADGEGRRIGRKIDGALVQGFLYGDDRRIVAELDGANTLVSRFVYADRDNVPGYFVKGGVTYRLVTDERGSVRLVVNAATGTVVQRLDYDPFGRVLTDTNPGFQPFGFAGGLYDSLTGLVRFGARDYDPEMGRWIRKDPILFAGGDTNLYAYVSNDPINTIDSNGQGRLKQFVNALRSPAARAIIKGALDGLNKLYRELEQRAKDLQRMINDLEKVCPRQTERIAKLQGALAATRVHQGVVADSIVALTVLSGLADVALGIADIGSTLFDKYIGDPAIEAILDPIFQPYQNALNQAGGP